MPEVSDVVGIGLAGGQGIRARPLTLKAPGYLRSKALKNQPLFVTIRLHQS